MNVREINRNIYFRKLEIQKPTCSYHIPHGCSCFLSTVRCAQNGNGRAVEQDRILYTSCRINDKGGKFVSVQIANI